MNRREEAVFQKNCPLTKGSVPTVRTPQKEPLAVLTRDRRRGQFETEYRFAQRLPAPGNPDSNLVLKGAKRNDADSAA